MKIALAVLFAVLVSVNGRSFTKKSASDSVEGPDCKKVEGFFKKHGKPEDLCSEDRRREKGEGKKPTLEQLCEAHLICLAKDNIKDIEEELTEDEAHKALDGGLKRRAFQKKEDGGDLAILLGCIEHGEDLIDGAVALGCVKNDDKKREPADDEPMSEDDKKEVCFWAHVCIEVFHELHKVVGEAEKQDKRSNEYEYSYEYTDENSDYSTSYEYSYEYTDEESDESTNDDDKRDVDLPDLDEILKIAKEVSKEELAKVCKEHEDEIKDQLKENECRKPKQGKREDEPDKEDFCHWGRECYEAGKEAKNGGDKRALLKALRALRTSHKRK